MSPYLYQSQMPDDCVPGWCLCLLKQILDNITIAPAACYSLQDKDRDWALYGSFAGDCQQTYNISPISMSCKAAVESRWYSSVEGGHQHER